MTTEVEVNSRFAPLMRHFSVERWLVKRYLLMLIMLAAVLISALSVIYCSHQSRQLFSQLQQQQKAAMLLEEEWGRLLLEHSTWAAPDRIHQLADERLRLIAPDSETTKMVVR